MRLQRVTANERGKTMSKLVSIAQALRDSGLTVSFDSRDNEVTVSDSDFQIVITEELGTFFGTLYAGSELNAHTYEEELFNYRNTRAVVGEVSRRVKQLNNLSD
jgi:hypothetical protein